MAVRTHLAFCVAAFAATTPLHGQCRLCDQPQVERRADTAAGDVDLRIETSLNFDRLILSGNGEGGAIIRPTGSNGAEGAVLEIGPRATVGAVAVHGQANREISIDVPHRVELYSDGGGRISLVDVTTDLPVSPRLDASGNLTFHFGGRLIVTGGDEGRYRGDLPITANYADDASILAGTLIGR